MNRITVWILLGFQQMLSANFGPTETTKKMQKGYIQSLKFSGELNSFCIVLWVAINIAWFIMGCMFLDLSTFFLGLHMFFWTWPYFFWTWRHKKCGRLAFVFPGPCGNNFCGPGWICVGPEGIVLDREGIYFWHRFLFFGPVHLLCGPCFHRSGGRTPLLYALALGRMFFGTLVPSFWTCTCLRTLHRAGDRGTRYEAKWMQEVAKSSG